MKVGVLHRDISYNNIMLDDKGNAVVNDWDHAGLVNPDSKKPRRAFRTVRALTLYVIVF